MKKKSTVCLMLAVLTAASLHGSVSAAGIEMPVETKSGMEAAIEPMSSTETPVEFESGTGTFAESESGTEASTEPESDTEPSTAPETDTEPSTEPETDTEPSTEPETDTEPSTEPESDTEPSTEPESDTEPSTEPESSSETEPSAGSSHESETNPPSDPGAVKQDPETVPKPSFSTDTIMTHYRMYHGRPQYRRWNETRKRWKDSRWLYDCRWNIKNLMLHPGKAITLTVGMLKPRCASKPVYWKSRNPRVVRARKSGRILAKKRGITRIVAVNRRTGRTIAKIKIIVRGKGL